MQQFIRNYVLPIIFFIMFLLGALYTAFAIWSKDTNLIVIGTLITIAGFLLTAFTCAPLNKTYSKTFKFFNRELTFSFTKTI